MIKRSFLRHKRWRGKTQTMAGNDGNDGGMAGMGRGRKFSALFAPIENEKGAENFLPLHQSVRFFYAVILTGMFLISATGAGMLKSEGMRRKTMST